MRFEEFVTTELRLAAANALKTRKENLEVTRLDSLKLPPVSTFKILQKVDVEDSIFVSATRLHDKDLYKLNYGLILCELPDSPKTKFCIFQSYSSDYGEIVILFTKKAEFTLNQADLLRLRVAYPTQEKYDLAKVKGELIEPAVVESKAHTFRVMRSFQRALKKNLDKIASPILEDGLLNEIQKNTVNFVRICQKRNLSLNRGTLLHGEPGNGKSYVTSYLRELAAHYNLTYRQFKQSKLDANELESMGDINVFDDFDISLLGAGRKGGALASDLLSAMSGTDKTAKSKAFIFTTNESVESLDAAFLRNGRIDIVRELKPPTRQLRERLITEKWPTEINLQIIREDSLKYLLNNTEGFSFADLDGIKDILLVAEFDGQNLTIEQAITKYYTNKNQKPKNKSKVGF